MKFKHLKIILIAMLISVFTETAFAANFKDACFYIKSKWENERLAAINDFIELDNENAVPFLARAVSDKTPAVRKRAAEALIKLGNLQDSITVPALLEQIKIEPDIPTLGVLIFALGNFSGEENTVKTFKEEFKSYEAEQKYNVLDALIPLAVNHKAAYLNFFEIITESQNSDDALLRLHAVINMGEFGDREYVTAPLIKALSDKYDDIRAMSCKYLGIIKPQQAIRPLVMVGLNDKSPMVRRKSVIAVRNYAHHDTFDFFKNILEFDLDGEVRGEAALAFIDLKDRRALPYLKNALLDSPNVVRLNSAYALAFFDDDKGQEELVWFLWEQNLPAYRQRAIKGLAMLNNRSVIDDLQRALSDWDDIVRETAFQALRHKWKHDVRTEPR